jgi:hypothetical protein
MLFLRFVHLIMRCVETVSFSIAVNGSIYGFFPGKNGVRQGDPLSLYLFITCMEYFSRMLQRVLLKDAAKGFYESWFSFPPEVWNP